MLKMKVRSVDTKGKIQMAVMCESYNGLDETARALATWAKRQPTSTMVQALIIADNLRLAERQGDVSKQESNR